jgi:hypothetical protein
MKCHGEQQMYQEYQTGLSGRKIPYVGVIVNVGDFFINLTKERIDI